MREFLFRGKRTDNDEWVEGFYQEYPKNYIHIQNASNDWFPVIPETVGQFTGLLDRNNKKIFEGDIVRAKFASNRSRQIFKVIFKDGMFLFDNGAVAVNKRDVYSFEVLGNIHDNSEELLDER